MNNNKEGRHDEMVSAALTEYFSTRHNLPGISTVSMTELARDDKTTEEIMEDLLPMMFITQDEVNDFMFFHDYKMAQQADGTVKWAIWRDMTVGAITD